MAETLQGYAQLQARLRAVGGTQIGPTLLRQLGTAAVREAKLLVPRKTGNLGRSIHLGTVSANSAEVVASAHYATYVEKGTGPHEITPNAKKALRWAASSAGRRLTGSPTKAAQRGGGGGVLFATRVHHPGTKPKPFLLPGAKAAVQKAGVADAIVTAWNDAA